MIAHIVAYDKERGIGKDNALLWRLPDDLAYFKQVTLNHAVLMGRKTFESIGRPLPNRRNIVVTRDETFAERFPDVEVWSDLSALSEWVDGPDTLFVIGGGEIYRQTTALARTFVVTEVDTVCDADTRYPELPDGLTLVASTEHPADERHAHAFRFRTWERS